MSEQESPPRPRVLVVDDEQGILNAVRRELSAAVRNGVGYELETFIDPHEALERARTVDFEVVVADYRMPEMDGLAFLKAFQSLQPDCMSIVLSGETDLDALIRMINETHIYRFMPKPWSSYLLRNSIDQAIAARNSRLENLRLARILREAGGRPEAARSTEPERVLILDDDIGTANALARCLIRQHTGDPAGGGNGAALEPSRISVQVCSNPEEAMELARDTSFACALVDYRMPGMNGAEFLASLADLQPDCAGILLSGVATLEGLVIALDLGQIHAFIAKPWRDAELRATVAEALRQRRVLLENCRLAELCRARGLVAQG